jgi:hypothetical protein
MGAMRAVALVVGAGLLIGVAPARADDAVRPAGATGPLGAERLSDERTLTRWAHPRRTARIRVRASRSAPSFARLRRRTEDGLPEVYLALRSYVRADGETWIRVRVPMRPNGRTGWVPLAALGRLHVVTTQLVVRRGARRAILRDGGRVVWRARVGIGAPGTPTPRGRFYVRELLRVADPRGIYGPYAFGTSAYSSLSDWPGGGVVGIHGTNAPSLIPGRPSHGCIRVRNARIRALARLMPVGTPIRVR